MNKEVLENIGLTSEEAEIYLSLVTKGAQGASALSRNTSVKRTYVYRIASTLAQKGLVSIVKKGRATTFEAKHPDNLLTLAQARQTEAAQAQNTLEGVLPTLREKHASTETRPVVTYFEGKEGLRKVFMDIYSPKSEPVYGAVDLEKADSAMPAYVIDDLIPLRIKNHVEAKSFLANSDQAKKVASKDGESLRQSVLLDKDKYPIPAEIDVYEDKVAMLSFEKGRFVGLLIQNKDIATSIKSLLRLAFEKSIK